MTNGADAAVRAADDASRAADDACHADLERLLGDLEARAWHPLRDAVNEACQAHRDVMEAAGLQGECPEGADTVRELAAGYLTAVAEKVQRPFWQALVANLPADAVTGAFDEARAHSREDCARLPTAAELEGDPLAPLPLDGPSRSLGRKLAGVVYAISSAPSPRVADVRAVAVRHRALRVRPLQEAWRVEASRLWSAWLGEVEACWAAWARPVIADLTGEVGAADLPAATAWLTLVNAGNALHTGLERLGARCPHESLTETSLGALSRCRGLLESDLSLAGTFLLRPGRAKDESSLGRPDDWKEWQLQAVTRLEMHAALLTLFIGVRRAHTVMVERLRGEILEAWRVLMADGGRELRAIADKVRAEPPKEAGPFDAARAEAQEVFSRLEQTCPTRGMLESVGRRVAGMAVGEVQACLRPVPSSLVLHAMPLAARPLRRPSGVSYTVVLQEMGRQAFDTLRMERLRTSAAPLVTSVEKEGASLDEIGGIVSFGFDAAAVELAGSAEERFERALELVVEALNRAADSLDRTTEAVEESLAKLDAQVTAEILGGFDALAERALADRMQGQLLDLRNRLSEVEAKLRRLAGPRVERGVRIAELQWVRTRRGVMRVVRWGRNLVATEPTGPTEATRTARSLATAEELVQGLPLVYQHLFTSDSVTEPVLLAGREVELAGVEEKWKRWKDVDGVPLLVTGRRGAGVSSFFNIFVSRIGEAGGKTIHQVLDRRITTEPALAAYLADVLDIEPAGTLDEFASRILAAPKGSLPDLLVIEGLEHLYLRVPGGTDLLERLFTLMAETEPRIFWAGSMTLSAWQVAEKSEPAAAAQLDRLDLSALSVADIQSAILLRHRRSGLRLSYEEPVEGRRILRRRVRRLRGTERHQEVLQRDYFDRLQRTSQGNLRLALFQWLRSVDFSAGDGTLVVRPLPPLDFSFLDSLNLTQNFTIKAFLEHQTLTLAEHDAVFRVTRQESYHVFESLGSRQIIEAAPRTEEDEAISEVRADIRYHIRPLLTGGVASHLASRNIVH